MLHLPSPALRLLVTESAIFILGDTAVVLRVGVSYVGAATDAGGLVVCTNVPAHIMTTGTSNFVGTFHVVVADDITLGVGGVGGTVLETLVVTWL